MSNEKSLAAKKAKKNEFYTQWSSIQKEINGYLEYDPNVFKGKTILLPCDDPDWSNFTKFFAKNFENFGLKKLISTSYALESKQYEFDFNKKSIENSDLKYDKVKSKTKGKVFILDKDISGDGKIDIDDLKWDYLEGDGNFSSPEVKKLRDESDIIITNPPFSEFINFVSWIMEANKKFLILGNIESASTKECFNYIKNNKMWLGLVANEAVEFEVPNNYEAQREDEDGNKYVTVPKISWFTNLIHGRKSEGLSGMMSMDDNIKFNKDYKRALNKGVGPYQIYQNYNAMEVSYASLVPLDYDGVMGVPVTFLKKYSAEQFQIVGMCEN